MNSLKKCLSFVLAALMMLSIISVATVSVGAKTIVRDGISYELDSSDMTATVVGYTSRSSEDEVVISSEVDGYKVAFIAARTFINNKDIVSVEMPDSILYIRDFAFDGCTNLREVKCSSNVEYIGKGAFRDCVNLGGMDIGSAVKTIGSVAFKNSAITEIEIPDTCTFLGDTAFYGCSELEIVKLSQSIETIYDSTFYGCSSLKEIAIPGNVKSIEDRAFYNCTTLKSVTMDEGTEQILFRAFQNCTSLESINLPDSLTYIGEGAFWDCDSLRQISIPAGVECMTYTSFRGCDSLTTVQLGQGVKTIEKYAFMNNSSLKAIAIPETVGTIDELAFSHCPGLVIYGSKGTEAQNFAKNMGLIFVGYEINEDGEAVITAYESPKVSDVELVAEINGAPVTTIAPDAFRDNASIRSITLSSGITQVGAHAFDGCTALENVILSAESTHIGEYAFANCPKIKNVCLPEEVATLDEGAFGFVLSGDEYVAAEGFHIYGWVGTAAQKYCEDNGIQFRLGLLKEVATDKIVMGMNYVEKIYEEGDEFRMIKVLGDTDFSGKVNVRDASAIQKHVADLVELSEEALIVSDTNLDSKVNVKDATQIQKYLVDIINSFYP